MKYYVIIHLPSVIQSYQKCYLVLRYDAKHAISFYLCLVKQLNLTMQLPSKYIAVLVILSLVGIFAYQGYWLTGLYRTMRQEMEQKINEAMRMADYNEMMIRVEKMKEDNKKNGVVSISAKYNKEGKSFIQSSAILSKKDTSSQAFVDMDIDTLLMDTLVGTSSSQKKEEAYKDSTYSAQAALRTKDGLDVILRDQRSMLELAGYFQRGLHSGLDIISDPDVTLYDSLLTGFLQKYGIDLPHRLEYLYRGAKVDSSFVFVDTLAIIKSPGYIPSQKAMKYDFNFDLHSNKSYRLWMEPVNMLVLKQMYGILTTSFVILIILSFSFWFLIRTILKQKSLEEMKSDFTNNITHELKTPIAVAYAANDALLNFDQAEDKIKREKYLRICQKQLQQLSRLVEQILSMSMEQRKTFRLQLEEFPIIEILEPLLEQHKLKAKKPVNFSIEITPKELSILADRTHFSNIISNLLDNAIKYSREKADIKICCRRIENEPFQPTEISIIDHGIGITAEKQKHIFEKFYRVPTGNLHQVKGYGLGLFYVKTLVEKQGGSIRVKSELNKGSVFTIRI